MTPIETRLRDSFPTIRMPLVGLIFALIFEMLMGKMIDFQGAWLFTLEGYLFYVGVHHWWRRKDIIAVRMQHAIGSRLAGIRRA